MLTLHPFYYAKMIITSRFYGSKMLFFKMVIIVHQLEKVTKCGQVRIEVSEL